VPIQDACCGQGQARLQLVNGWQPGEDP